LLIVACVPMLPAMFIGSEGDRPEGWGVISKSRLTPHVLDGLCYERGNAGLAESDVIGIDMIVPPEREHGLSEGPLGDRARTGERSG
jgi:hypothetical protein